jgi:hypothetical protein
MENLNVILEEFTTSIDSGFPSVYSKEDVKILLSMFAQKANVVVPQPTGMVVTEEVLSKLMEDIADTFENVLDDTRYNDYVDTGSAEFSIDYGNQLVLDSVDLNTSEITRKLRETIETELGSFVYSLLNSEDNADQTENE